MEKGIQITSKQMDECIQSLDINSRYKDGNTSIYTKDGVTQVKVTGTGESLRIFAYNKAKKFTQQQARA